MSRFHRRVLVVGGLVAAAGALGAATGVGGSAEASRADASLAVAGCPSAAVPAPGKPGVRVYASPFVRTGGDGSFAHALSLRRALERLRPGDTLVLRRGSYRGTIVVYHDGAPGRPIVVRSYPRERAVIHGRLVLTGSHVVVEHVVFDGSRGAALDVRGKHDWIVYAEVEHARGSGVVVGTGADALSIVATWIHDNRKSGIAWSGGAGGLLEDDVIDHNAGVGVRLAPNVDRTIVRRDTVVGNGRAGIVLGGKGKVTSDGDLLAWNVVAFNGGNGIATSWRGPSGGGDAASDTLGYGNRGDSVGGRGLEVAGTIEINPSFRAPSHRDFRLADPVLQRVYGARLSPDCADPTRAARTHPRPTRPIHAP